MAAGPGLAAEVRHRVTLPDGGRRVIPHPKPGPRLTPVDPVAVEPREFAGRTRRVPLGEVAGARPGDKGGSANIGLWTRTGAEYEWLRRYLDETRFRAMLPEAAALEVRRFETAEPAGARLRGGRSPR
ncbi:hypothetical protein AB0K15_45885 [Amycolatopsis sp. NPDC049253]|uniref:hypothetical protein n=1 Tax=Amycolatopsis sp. NPDC049253 TaxID=3155274 RepID=UPI0034240F65